MDEAIVAAPAAIVHRPDSVAAAVGLLTERGVQRQVLAGASWVMRAPLRGEHLPREAVSVSGIDALRRLQIQPDLLAVGAGVTHAQLAQALADVPELQGLASAAGQSANPAIRAVATVGGNLCTSAFAAADLVPALLCLDAEVEYATAEGTDRMPLEIFLAKRGALDAGLLTHVFVRRGAYRSAHARLPLRKAGDYPVAIVSLAAKLAPDGRIAQARIAVGSVEPVPRRWTELEAVIAGREPDPIAFGQEAARLSQTFAGRDGIEAPGWYRVHVLPALVRRAFENLRIQWSEA